MKNRLISVLTNLCLAGIVFCVVAACGFVGGGEAVAAVKSYRGVIYAGNPQSGKISLMINVYWGTGFLMDMLDTLKEYEAKCTFFVGETWVRANPEVFDRIVREGHEIGNHGSDHLEHARLSSEQNREQIMRCHELVLGHGVTMNLFAPPGGSYSDETVRVANELGYKTILWTHDTIDWRDQDEEVIFARATSELRSGDLVLMHPTMATRNVLGRILEAVKSKKLAPDTVSNTIKE